jgi:hypothetical protein
MNMEDARRHKLEKLLDQCDRALFLYYLGFDPVHRGGFT